MSDTPLALDAYEKLAARYAGFCIGQDEGRHEL